METGFEVLKALAEPRFKIGDIAFVKSEAEAIGKYVPVIITGIYYDMATAHYGYRKDLEYMQPPKYKTQLIHVRVNDNRGERSTVAKTIEFADIKCYSADELITEDAAEKLVTRGNKMAQEQFKSTLRMNEATLNVLAYPENEMPFEQAIVVNRTPGALPEETEPPIMLFKETGF
ncbi:MAG: hypothetical protein PHT95_05965 [Candidatus Omnitrophica bacterium]|nr:hypothetical protein [Candidatus Omnitrophota bacterium]